MILISLGLIASLYFLFLSQKNKSLYLLLVALFFFIISLMYVSSYLLFPSFLFLYILFYKRLTSGKGIIAAILQFFILFSLFYLPVLIFEASHNYYTFRVLSSAGERFVHFNPILFTMSFNTHLKLFLESVFYSDYYFYYYMILFFVPLSIFFIKSLWRIIRNNKKIAMLVLMFFPAIFFTGFYSKEAYIWRLAPLYPLFFLLLAYVISYFHRKAGRYSTDGKRYLKLIIFLILSRFLMVNYIPYISMPFKAIRRKYDTFFNVAEYILKSSKDKEYSIYTIALDNDSGYDNTSYYYALIKLSGKNIASYYDSGNWVRVSPNTEKGWLYLICKEYVKSFPIINDQCFRQFQKISKIRRDSYIEKKYILDDIVYKIDASEDLYK